MAGPDSSVRHKRFDVAVAFVVLALGQAEIWGNGAIRNHASAGAPLYALMALCLVGRRSRPFSSGLGTVVCGCAALLSGVPMHEMFVPVLAFMVAMYSVGLYCDRRRALVALGLSLVSVWTTIAIVGGLTLIGDFPMASLQLIGAWSAGRLVQRRLSDAVEAERRLGDVRAEAAMATRDAVTHERMRIARELHDIVSHGLSLMIVQAGAAEQALDIDPRRTAESLRAVQDAGRSALGDMQRLLGLLRWSGDHDSLVPQPSLDTLDNLVDQVRKAGLPVELTIDGPTRPLPPGLDVCVYRVLQEALTNVVKHAQFAHTQVSLRYGPDRLDLEVLNAAGGTASAEKPPGHSHGLVGMRERISVCGGRLHCGATADGGYSVRASVPIGAV